MSASTISESAIARLQTLHTDYISSEDGQSFDNAVEQINDCFGNMSSQWQQGHYDSIVEQCDALPLYCLCDIRICVYYLYSLWSTHKNNTIANAITILANVIKQEQQVQLSTQLTQTPIVRSKVLNNSIGLFFRQTLKHLENPSIDVYITEENPGQAIIAIDHLQQLLNAQQIALDDDVSGAMIKLKKYFSTIQEQIAKNNIRNTQTANPQGDISGIEIDNNFLHFSKNTEFTKKQNEEDLSPTTKSSPNDQQFIKTSPTNPSYPLQKLLKKMQVLKALIETRQDLKSAIVLVDIQNELDNFNPLVYFPEYFSGFAGLRVKHAQKLEPYFSQHDSFQWQVLNDYYHADMRAFVELEDDKYSKPCISPNPKGYRGYGNDEFEPGYPEAEYDD